MPGSPPRQRLRPLARPPAGRSAAKSSSISSMVSPSQAPKPRSRSRSSSTTGTPSRAERSPRSPAPAPDRSSRSGPAGRAVAGARAPGDARSRSSPCRVALPAVVAVPVGLPVADQEQRRHRLYASQPWSWDSEDVSASSLARPEGSVSRPRACSRRRGRASSSRVAIRAGRAGAQSREPSAASPRTSARPEVRRRRSPPPWELGGLDCLVNNVGVAYDSDFLQVTDEVGRALAGQRAEPSARFAPSHR